MHDRFGDPPASSARFRLPGVLLLLTLGVACGARGAAAQERSNEILVVGQVVDREERSPVGGALVRLIDRDTHLLTDSLGYFRFPAAIGSELRVEASRLGYGRNEGTVRVLREGDPFLIPLTPKPVVLEGIEVLASRLETLRNSTGVSVRALEQRELETAVVASTLSLLQERGDLSVQPCSVNSLNSCALVRGRNWRPIVYIDGIIAPASLDQLSFYKPYDLYSVEVFAGGMQIHAYTKQYIERVGPERVVIPPLITGLRPR